MRLLQSLDAQGHLASWGVPYAYRPVTKGNLPTLRRTRHFLFEPRRCWSVSESFRDPPI